MFFRNSLKQLKPSRLLNKVCTLHPMCEYDVDMQ